MARSPTRESPARKPARRKLKVFQARIGFHDMAVAVPSRAAALRAWDVQQDLFAQGEAGPATDPDAIALAQANPGVPVMRAAGSDAPFALKPGALPDLPDPAPSPARKAAATTKGAKANKKADKPRSKPAPRPDRRALDKAEAALEALEAARAEEEETLRRAQQELDDRRAAALKDYAQRRREAAEAVTRARRAWRKAGGEAD